MPLSRTSALRLAFWLVAVTSLVLMLVAVAHPAGLPIHDSSIGQIIHTQSGPVPVDG